MERAAAVPVAGADFVGLAAGCEDDAMHARKFRGLVPLMTRLRKL